MHEQPVTQHPSSPLFRVYLCGPFQVERWNGTSYEPLSLKTWGGSNDPRRLLKRLLCSPRRQVRRGELLEDLWSEVDPNISRNYLNDAVYRLRGALCPAKGAKSLLITADDHSNLAVLGQERLWVDADAALALLAQAELVEREGGDTVLLVQEASRLLERGQFLEEEEGLWAHGRRATIERTRHGCLLWQARLYQQRGSLRQAETLLNALIEQDAMDEDALCLLMTNLHLQQRTSEALRLFEETARLLHENGLEVAISTKEIAAHIRTEPLPKNFRVSNAVFSHSMTADALSLPDPISVQEAFIPPSLTTEMPLIKDKVQYWITRLFSDITSPAAIINETYHPQNKAEANLDSLQTRRQVLHYLLMIGSTALVLSPYAILHHEVSDDLSLTVLEELEAITTSYWRLCANTSLDLLGSLSEHFRTVVNSLQKVLPHTTAQRLCSLAGEIAQILGKTLFDLHEFTLAWSYYMFSLKAAQAASNHDLWATGIGRMILLLIYWERPQNALPLLQEVRQLNIQNTRIVCWLAAVEAEVHAYLGNAESCDAALKRAKDSSKNEPFGEDQYATGFSPSRLAGYEGACFVRLHQPDRALSALQEALALLDPQAIRRQSTLLSDMGIAYAQQGNIQQACQLAVQALFITQQTKSRSVLERVRTVRTTLEAWKETDEVQYLEKQLDTTSTLITV